MKIDFCRLVEDNRQSKPETMQRKVSVALRSSLVNMTKSAGTVSYHPKAVNVNLRTENKLFVDFYFLNLNMFIAS